MSKFKIGDKLISKDGETAYVSAVMRLNKEYYYFLTDYFDGWSGMPDALDWKRESSVIHTKKSNPFVILTHMSHGD